MKTETLDEFLKRGGQISRVKTETRSCKEQSEIDQRTIASGYLGLGPKPKKVSKTPVAED